jgi:WD repeat-containing protein 35
LWRLYAKKALEDHDFDAAENAFVACNDYASLLFVKRIKELDDKEKQKAEVFAYYGKFEEADE